jgi:hypothetical protein
LVAYDPFDSVFSAAPPGRGADGVQLKLAVGVDQQVAQRFVRSRFAAVQLPHAENEVGSLAGANGLTLRASRV